MRRTPVLDLGNELSNQFSLALKLEHLQVGGSFKVRGALAALTAIEAADSGVVAASGGNFGIAVSYAASRVGYRATVFVPDTSPAEKIDRIASFGSEVNVVNGYYDEALAASKLFADRSGAVQLHAYDQHDVVAGQGTIAREIIRETNADVIVVAVGGGGLIGGIASQIRDDAVVVAVEPERCPGFNAALAAGRPVETEVGGLAASSLGARMVGDHCWAARAWINDSVLVSDEDIGAAQRWLWERTRLAVEPAAATTVAALHTGVFRPPPGSRVVAVLSGGNVDLSTVT